MKRSIFGLLAAAFSTESIIRVTIDSSSGFSTFILISPEVLTHPEITEDPGDAQQQVPVLRLQEKYRSLFHRL